MQKTQKTRKALETRETREGRALFASALIALSVLSACEEPRRRPWEKADDGGTTPVFAPAPSSLLVAPTSASPQSPPLSADGGSSELIDASAGAPPVDLEPPVRVGGPWVRCYGNFRIEGDPVKDVTRLALLCGPENGMKRLSPQTIVGHVIEGQPSVSEAFQSKRGECYRIFAVAEPSVTDLDVTVKSSRDAAIAADHGEDAWPIVQPDRPFCVLEDDTLRVEFSAHRGQGRFAAEIWVLARGGAEGSVGGEPGSVGRPAHRDREMRPD